MSKRVDARCDELKQHGYKIRFADPADAYSTGMVMWHQVADFSEEPGDCPFIELQDASDDDGRHYHAFWQRSNFRSLLRDHGDTFVRIGYNGSDSLGLFVHSVSDEVIELACRLSDSAIYDEDDWSAFEHDEATESFSLWLHHDLYRDLPEWWQDIDSEFSDAAIEHEFWVAVSDDSHSDDPWNCSDSEVTWDMERAEACLIKALRVLKRRQLGRESAPNV